MVRAILTDIEGTTTSLNFVKDELFPYALERLPYFISNNRERLDEVYKQMEEIFEPGIETSLVIQVMLDWMARDIKSTPLKTVQGMIWEEGYAKHELRGHLYEDAFNTLRSWYLKSIPVYIYSSGSVQAQKLLFKHSMYGDISKLLSGHFDTTIGSKLESSSYKAIAESLNLPVEDILFLSDNPVEIDAAFLAGMQVQLVDRDGRAPYSVKSFYELAF